jgi:hypothetical protein
VFGLGAMTGKFSLSLGEKRRPSGVNEAPTSENRPEKPWNAVGKSGAPFALFSQQRLEGAMTHTLTVRRVFAEIGGFLEHFVVVVLGFVLMVIGLGLGVTMIMLPVGIVLGLVGMGLFVAGIFGHLDSR